MHGISFNPRSVLGDEIAIQKIETLQEEFNQFRDQLSLSYTMDTGTVLPIYEFSGTTKYGGSFAANEDVIVAGYKDGIKYSIDNTKTWVEISGIEPAGYVTCYGESGVFVAISTDLSHFYYSVDGIHWVASNSTFENYSIFVLTYGNNKFIAVGQNSESQPIVVQSKDGVEWTAHTVSLQLQDITYTNGVFVGYTESNSIARSFNGIDWEEITFPYNYEIHAVYSGGGSFFLVTADDSVGNLYRSVDGVTWTSTQVSTDPLASFAYGEGKYVVTVEASDITYFYISSDSYSWQRVETLDNRVITSVDYILGRFILLNINTPDSLVYWSPFNLLLLSNLSSSLDQLIKNSGVLYNAASVNTGTAVLPVGTSWTGPDQTTGLYTYTVNINGLTSSSNVHVTPVIDVTDADTGNAQQDAWDTHYWSETVSGGIKFYAAEQPGVAVQFAWMVIS